MECIQIIRVSELDEVLIAHLIEESLSQGFRFVERLFQEYSSGVNNFDKPGEALFAALLNSRVIGVGGLNHDPYLNDPNIGRLRHLYVESAWRRQGVGGLLVSQIIHEARRHYRLLTLRADMLAATTFYQVLGFKTEPSWAHTTHHLQLGEVDYYPPNLL